MTQPNLVPEEQLLAATIALVASWSSAQVQTEIARAVGLDLPESDVRTLYMLGARGEARPSDLAETLHVTRPTMSKTLTRLTRQGLIERLPAERDQRAVVITLTVAGQSAYQLLQGAGIDMVRRAAVSLDRTEVAQLTRVLHTLAEGLQHDEHQRRTK